MNKQLINRKTLRIQIRQKRGLLTDKFQKKASQHLVKQLDSHPTLLNAKNVAIYLANDSELDPVNLIKWCWQHNIKTYLPVIHPFTKGQLLFLHYYESSQLQLNRYDILEPVLNVSDVIPTHQLDIIFTPLVAFTKTGERLGMGGGYYDRTLAAWFEKIKGDRYNPPKKTVLTKPYPIGLAHDCQLVNKIPTEQWDIPLPEIVTPTKHYQFKLSEN